MERPVSVTIVAVVQLIFSLLGVLGGLLLMFGGAFLGGLAGAAASENAFGAAGGMLVGFLIPLLFSLVSIIQFVSSIGLLATNQTWPWFGTVITQVIGLLLNVIQIFIGNFFAIIGGIVGIIILAVMLQQNARRAYRM